MDQKIILIAGGAAALWWYFSQNKTPTATSRILPAPGQPGPGPSAPPATPPATTTPPAGTGQPPSGNSLAAIQARMQAAASNSGMATASPDQWNWLFGNVSSLSAPDPVELWPDYDRTNYLNLTLDQYWGKMAPYLTTARGMSALPSLRRRSYFPGGWVT